MCGTVREIMWTSDTTFELEGTSYLCSPTGIDIAPRAAVDRFCLAKVRRSVEQYVELLDQLRPEVIVELGILEGASTALFADLCRPRRLVTIDNRPTNPKLAAFIERRGYEGVISAHGEIDQADRATVASILELELGPEPVDLVVDDASHRFEPTLGTFNLLFPRLRTGGVYVIEDWATGLKADGPVPMGPELRPLVDIVTEILRAKGRRPRLIGDVRVRSGWVEVERGDEAVSEGFDLTA